jgi:hypothetical protein
MSQADCRELKFQLEVDSSTPVVIYWGNQLTESILKEKNP